MNLRNVSLVSLLLFVLVRTTVSGNGRNFNHNNKKAKNGFSKNIISSTPTPYELYESNVLPSDLQISTFLKKGETKIFFYHSTISNFPLSFTVILCTSNIYWTLKHRKNNLTTVQEFPSDIQIGNFTIKDLQTLHVPSAKGTYVISLTALDKDSYTHLYVSTEPGGPQALQSRNPQKIKLLKRQRRKRLTIRWEKSLVDPQNTEYCLVISSKKKYSSLCSAEGDRYGIISPQNLPNPPVAASQTVTAWDAELASESEIKEPIVACVGVKTHYTISGLKNGIGYYYDVFATNHQSNFTYRLGSNYAVYESNFKPTSLRDGKATFINLKKLDGKAIFRYKVAKDANDSIKLYVMPCGGAVDVEVIHKGNVVVSKKRVDGLGRILVRNAIRGERYHVRVLSANREELRRTSGVEVLATTKPSAHLPLPNMPSESTVYEYVSQKSCDSITVGWMVSPGTKMAHYCVLVREGRLRETEGLKMPNQCGLENRLKKSADFVAKYCQNIKQSNEKVKMQQIKELKPGRNYVVQVTVKKPKGKTLSYDLLQVKTKPYCDKYTHHLSKAP